MVRKKKEPTESHQETSLYTKINPDGTCNVILKWQNTEELVTLLIHLLSGSVYSAAEEIIKTESGHSDYMNVVNLVKRSLKMLNKSSNMPVMNPTQVFKRSYFG